MRRILVRIGVLLAVFIAGVVAMSLLLNKETTENKTDMPNASLPIMSIGVGDSQVNRLYGYKEKMQVDFMRDSLTPIDTDKDVTIFVKTYGHKLKSAAYEVRTSDGSKVVENAKIKKFEKKNDEETATITIEGSLRVNQEYSLRFELATDKGTYYYYTRVIQRSGLNTEKYIEFVQNFYTKCLDKETASELTSYLETDATIINNSYTGVNIHSTWSQLTWGSLSPQLYRKGIPSIKDINETTGSFFVEYMITAKDTEGNDEYYQVTEFYRLRYTQARVLLLNFERSAVQVFDPSLPVVTQDSVNLGVTFKDVQHVTNQAGDIIAFVQAGDLWTYNRTAGKMTCVFSFRDEEENDERADYSAHDIKIVRVGETGDLDFVLYGYMNRGEHEGSVGTGVYHYNSDQNVLEEKFFLPSTISYEFLKRDLSSLSYVSTQEMLYLLLEGNLYQMSLADKSYQVLKSGIENDSFVVSETHAHAAWMEEMDPNNSTQITEIDLETAKMRTITAQPGTKIKAMGFINEDLVYGIANDQDILTDAQGALQYAMHEIRIESFEGTLIKNYQEDGIYIMDVKIEQGLLELIRAEWTEDAYVLTSSDHIMNNARQKEEESNTVTISAKVTERQGTLIYMSFSQAMRATEPLVVKSKIMVPNGDRTLDMSVESEYRQEYYVYANGKLDSIYDNANEAVARADEQTGVVLNRDQQYVWERGNKKSRMNMNLEDVPEEFRNGTMDVEALQNAIGDAGTVIDLSGCTLDAVLYEVSCMRPVAARVSETESVVIVGYDPYNTILYYPATGETGYYGMNDSTALFEAAGNVFVSYVENLG